MKLYLLITSVYGYEDEEVSVNSVWESKEQAEAMKLVLEDEYKSASELPNLFGKCEWQQHREEINKQDRGENFNWCRIDEIELNKLGDI